MGTQLQELGHDAVMRGLVTQVLAPRLPECFFLLNPAVGPKRDILWRPEPDSAHASAYAESPGDFIPEFQHRVRLGKRELAFIESTTKYRDTRWYKWLSETIGGDLRSHLQQTCTTLEARVGGDLPDIIAFDMKGSPITFAEVKFEGLSRKALEAILDEYSVARALGVPYYLAIPRSPIYTRARSDGWVNAHVPRDIRCYRFTIPTGMVLPRQAALAFERISDGQQR